MPEGENRIPLDVRDFQNSASFDFDIPDFQFTKKESGYVPEFLSMHEAVLHVQGHNAGHMISLTISVEGKCLLRDAHSHKEVEYPLSDSVDVLLHSENEEENDILPDKDGIYDLRGSVLALMFDAIPKNYSEVPLERYEEDNFVVMSQDEYEREHAKSSSPFADLDDID